MTATVQPQTILFPLGALRASSGAVHQFDIEEIQTCLRRHACGDWGDCGPDDRAANNAALLLGDDGEPAGRVFSSYELESGRLWIITEQDRSATTCILPEEY